MFPYQTPSQTPSLNPQSSLSSNINTNPQRYTTQSSMIYRHRSPQPEHAVYNDYQNYSNQGQQVTYQNNLNNYVSVGGNNYEQGSKFMMTGSGNNNNNNQYLLGQNSGVGDRQASLSFGLTQQSNLQLNNNNLQHNMGSKNAVSAKCKNSDDTYLGQLNSQGQPHGYGKYFYNTIKCEYHGYFLNGKPQGQGILYFNANNNLQTIYQGQWKNGLKNGMGRYNYDLNKPTTHYYQGPWLNDKRHGDNGMYINPNYQYIGRWKNGNMTNGQLNFQRSRSKYVGEFQNGEMVRGIVIYQNGDQYQGKLKNGLRHDDRAIYTFNRPDGRIKYRGKYSMDTKLQSQSPNPKQITQKGIHYENGDILMGTFQSNRFKYGMPCVYRWADGDLLEGWLSENGGVNGGYKIKGVVTRPNGEKYQVR